MNLRHQLVSIALEWQRRFGVAPPITSALSEYDAALLVGCSEENYALYMRDKTAVARGADFIHEGKRYQVKACRPSGKQGSRITWVPKANNFDWDYLIWVHYTTTYDIIEAWLWNVDDYRQSFESVT